AAIRWLSLYQPPVTRYRSSPIGRLRVSADIAAAAAKTTSSQREREPSSTASAQASTTRASGTQAGLPLGTRETACPSASFGEAFGSHTAELADGRNTSQASTQPAPISSVSAANGHSRLPAPGRR